MYILGLSSFAHESSCALIKDGKILVLLEEERFNRKKHTWEFPKQSIDGCLRSADITFKDIEHITFFWQPLKELSGNLNHVIKYFPQSLNLLMAGSGGNELKTLNRIYLMHNVKREIQKQFGISSCPPIHFMEHHLCHAASAFFVSPFEEAAILTMDGRGENTSTLLASGKNNKIQKIKEIPVPHSLGHLFAAITDYLGFRPFSDEWKVMGMSAYGKDTYLQAFNDLIYLLPKGEYHLNLKYFNFHTHGQNKWMSDVFLKTFGPKRNHNDPYDQKHFDIAFALQKTVEKAGVHLAQGLYDLTQSPNLCFTGGVVLNCLMNQKIIEQTPFKNFFIQPIASDAGTSLGSALYYYHQTLNQPRHERFDSAYLGLSFSDEQIETVLLAKNITYQKSKFIAKDTARLIAQGKIVGWFQGRMEAGPRALGNRSIVVDPTDPSMKDRLNSRVKKREFFRPFAPSVLEEKASDFFLMPKNQPSPYMILTGMVKEEKRNSIPAVTHADGTARVQTVNKKTNPLYWELIHEFEQLSGVPILLNTSFNENEPIVRTPEEAIDCFLRTDFDVLSIGNFIVTKKL